MMFNYRDLINKSVPSYYVVTDICRKVSVTFIYLNEAALPSIPTKERLFFK